MATPTIAVDSPVPTQIRNYHLIGDQIFNQVEKVISGAVAGTTAESAITALIATINTGGGDAPTKWAAFVAAAGAVIDCCEANNTQAARTKLWQTARHYLASGLLDHVKQEEEGRQKNRGLFITQGRVTDLNYLAGVFGDCMSHNQTLTVEAS